MKRKNMILPALLLAAASSFASPVQPGNKKSLTLADGTTVVAEHFGDEYINWWETADGKRYVPSDDNSGIYVEADFSAMQNAADAKRAAIRKMQGSTGRDHTTYTGKKKGLIVLVEFADQSFEAKHDRAYYETIANTQGLTNDEGYVGSVSDYFRAQSNGQFDLTFDIVGPVKLSKKYSYYGENSSKKYDVHVGDMVREATDAIANQVNFANYDWDGDGTADHVFYLYAGLNEAAGGDDNTIWPKMDYMVNNGGTLSYSTGNVNRFACSSELMGVLKNGKYTGELVTTGIGTICHEFSHCLGFPDMYDTRGQQLYAMGYYDLMSDGNYLGNGLVPPNYTAWERIYAGWVEPIVLDRASTVKAMASSTDYGRPFIMYNDNNPDEYYLFENRQKTGWDSALYGQGLMITHVDYLKRRWTSNTVNASGYDHQRCTIFHADNNESMGSRAEIAGDLYPYKGKNISGTYYGANNELTDTSKPAATLWNSHDESLGITNMGKPVTEITQNEDGTIAFLVMGGDDSNILVNAQPTGISSINADKPRRADNAVYTLDGRRIATHATENLPAGIYIVNGKKIVK